MTDNITISLNRLTPWKGNVRKTGAAEGIDELAASIAAHGQLQALVVREGNRGKYEIIAGRRRFLALSSLAKQGRITKDHPVNCTLAAAGVDETEISLAENVVRVSMHPADQFEAFSKLIDDGASTADVAARFGVPEKLIAQRLKLGRLSKVILEAYRQGDIDLEAAQAFAITDDQAAQERVFADLSSWNCSAHVIRRALTEGDIRATDKRVRFIGLDAYEAAGGALRRDLFGDDDDGFILDTELLNRLVAEKLAPIASELSSEGWRWTETVVDIDHEALARFARRHPERIDLPEPDQTELDSLVEEYDALVDTDGDDATERLAIIEQRIDELTALSQSWPGATLALAGAIVSLDYDGGVSIERGLVRKEDLKADDSNAEKASDDDVAKAADRAGLSPRLIEDLTAHKSAAIGAELMSQPDIALATVVHCLALSSFYRSCTTDSCLQLFRGSFSLQKLLTKPDGCSGLAAIQKQRERVVNRLPADPDALWQWCLDRSRDELLDLLAIIAAKAVNAVRCKADHADASRLMHANDLAKSLKLNMGAWFTPTAENYFNRINRAQILASIDEAKGDHAPSLEKLKKSELAVRAESLIAETGWLPEPLRIVPDNDSALSEAQALAAA